MTITTSKNCGICVCDHMPKKYLVVHVAAKHEVVVRLFCNEGLLDPFSVVVFIRNVYKSIIAGMTE